MYQNQRKSHLRKGERRQNTKRSQHDHLQKLTKSPDPQGTRWGERTRKKESWGKGIEENFKKVQQRGTPHQALRNGAVRRGIRRTRQRKTGGETHFPSRKKDQMGGTVDGGEGIRSEILGPIKKIRTGIESYSVLERQKGRKKTHGTRGAEREDAA